MGAVGESLEQGRRGPSVGVVAGGPFFMEVGEMDFWDHVVPALNALGSFEFSLEEIAAYGEEWNGEEAE